MAHVWFVSWHHPPARKKRNVGGATTAGRRERREQLQVKQMNIHDEESAI